MKVVVTIISSLMLCACVNDNSDRQANQQLEEKEKVNSLIYVSKQGNDSNSGTQDEPLLTINKAAQLANAGDTVIVSEGVYRESIDPKNGGTSESNRVTYMAAPGEDVRILGSENYRDWVRYSESVWVVTIPNSRFGEFNPFATLTRHPIPVDEDEEGDGWGWLKYGRWTHLGDVVVAGQGLTEKQTLAEVADTALTWFVETNDESTTIYANFGSIDPAKTGVELSHRATAITPTTSGLGYISIRGFTIMNTANHWAPPVHYQPAALHTNGGHHWVIEDNVILYAKASCISLGNPTGEANLEASGYHVVRNNVLLRCGQSGTVGAVWNKHSEISGNYIADVNYRREFGGWETAGIKHHVTNNLSIKNNWIKGVHTIDPEVGAAHGVWIDYQNKNWRVTGNVIQDTEGLAILTEANWDGPNLIDNNLVFGGGIGSYSTHGDHWLNNLFADVENKTENQDWDNRIRVADAKWINNVFIGGGFSEANESDSSVYQGNVYANGAKAHSEETSSQRIDFDFSIKNDGLSGDELELFFDLTEPEMELFQRQIISSAVQLHENFDEQLSVDQNWLGLPRTDELNHAGPFSTIHQTKLISPPPALSARLAYARKVLSGH